MRGYWPNKSHLCFGSVDSISRTSTQSIIFWLQRQSVSKMPCFQVQHLLGEDCFLFYLWGRGSRMEALTWSSINCNRVCSWATDYHLHSCISCFINRLNYLSRSTQVPWLPLEHLHNFSPEPNKLAPQELQLQFVCVCVSCSVVSDSLWPHGL